MKKTIMMAFALLLTVGLVTGCGCSKKDDKKKEDSVVKENTKEEVIKDREVDGIKVTNTSLVTVDGMSTLETTVTNVTDEDYNLVEYKIIVKDKKGNVIVELPGFVGDTIKAGESTVLTSSVDKDLTTAESIEIEVIK